MNNKNAQTILENFWKLRYEPINMSYEQFLNCLLDYLNEKNITLSPDNFVDVIENLDKYIIEKLSHCKNCL